METSSVPPTPPNRAALRHTAKGRQPSPETYAAIDALLPASARARTYLIENLHRLHDHFGHLSSAHIAALAQWMHLSQVEVYEVATFYHHFDVIREGETPPPKTTIRVCNSVSCMLAGAHALTEALKGTYGATSSEVRVLHAPCVGACDQAPVAVVNQTQIKRAHPAVVEEAVRRIASGKTNPPTHAPLDKPRFEVLARCAAGDLSVEQVIATLSEAKLRGMGGAGFPAGRKWSIVRSYPGPRALVVNADEGEPGTFKDRFYLERHPWQFWEGVLIAAWAIDATAIYVYLRDEYHDLRGPLHAQLSVLRQEFAQHLPATVEIRRGAGAYICGEESALIESIEGKRGWPRLRPPYVAEVGVFGMPTLAHNVETLYWAPEILAKGLAWWTSHGRHGRVGLRSYSVSGRVKQPGVKLAPAGITLQELIDEYCGGMAPGHTLYGYLPGGASGGILPARLANVPLDFDTLQEYGCFIGSAGIVVFSQADNVQDIAFNLMRFFKEESCGQCTPCRDGTAKAITLMPRGAWNKEALTELSHTMMEASICGLGQAAPNPVLTAMRYFPEAF